MVGNERCLRPAVTYAAEIFPRRLLVWALRKSRQPSLVPTTFYHDGNTQPTTTTNSAPIIWPVLPTNDCYKNDFLALWIDWSPLAFLQKCNVAMVYLFIILSCDASLYLLRLMIAWINTNYVQVSPVMGEGCTWQIFLCEENLIYNHDQSQPAAKSGKYIFIRWSVVHFSGSDPVPDGGGSGWLSHSVPGHTQQS